MLEDQDLSQASELVGGEVPPFRPATENGMKGDDNKAALHGAMHAWISAWGGSLDRRVDPDKSAFAHLSCTMASQDRHDDAVRRISARGRSDYPDDLELLELLISAGDSRCDTCELAMSLYRRFGSFEGVIAASITDLMTIRHMNENLAALIKAVYFAVARAALSKLRQPRSILKKFNIQSYLRAVLPKDGKSEYRVLHFGSTGRLLDEDVAEGSIGASPHIYPRNVITRCLELGTASVVVGTNREELLHSRTSYGEVEVFFRVKEALRLFDVSFFGILVYTRSGFQPVLCHSK